MSKKHTAPKYRVFEHPATENIRGVVFIVTSFKTKAWQYKSVAKTLNREGYKVYIYDYLWRPLLEVYPEEWVSFSTKIVQDIDKKIARNKAPGISFGIIGVSVGSIISMHAAKVLSDIKSVMLVTIYGSSAQHVWEHPSLNKMRSKFENSSMSVKEAYDIFEHLEPTYKIDLLKSKRLLVYANELDPVIRFSNTQILLDSLNEAGVSHELKLVRSRRHSLTIVKALRRYDEWLKFFNEAQEQ